MWCIGHRDSTCRLPLFFWVARFRVKFFSFLCSGFGVGEKLVIVRFMSFRMSSFPFFVVVRFRTAHVVSL